MSQPIRKPIITSNKYSINVLKEEYKQDILEQLNSLILKYKNRVKGKPRRLCKTIPKLPNTALVL